ncbi:MAG: hypothetical protein GY811_14350, partial [Myxococcales bacterium]|nr:hypothetical protein [Myxococcales bacterium]
DPKRSQALAAIEALYLARGEHRELDRLYRRLLFHIGKHANSEGAIIWRRMGDLHKHYLRNSDQALLAYEEAYKRNPDDEELQAIINELRTGGGGSLFEECDALVSHWREAPSVWDPIRSVYANAESGNQFDASFLAASALVASNQATAEHQGAFGRFRPRFLLRAQKRIGSKQWEELLHEGDFALVGALYAHLSDTIAEQYPAVETQEEVAQADEVPDASLSPQFRATRTCVANILGVSEPAIYSRADYGHSIHVAPLGTPVLLAGYDAVTCTDKIELAYRLARAMSYLRPGRAIVSRCPSRVLKNAMMACYTLVAPNAVVPDPEGGIAELRAAIQKLDETSQYQALELVAHISHEHPTLNLSQWTRDLARTADRCGLLVCGDLPLSLRCLGEPIHSKAAIELLGFGLSSHHLRLRSNMGLSIEV